MNLIAGQGLEGDRYNYALQTGTYSASFIDEPGKNLTMVSADASRSRWLRPACSRSRGAWARCGGTWSCEG